MSTTSKVPIAGSGTVSVDLANVSKRYGRRRVLAGISASVAFGGVLGISGPNGSGKSTLVRIIAGLLAPDGGYAAVHAEGRSLDRSARRAVIGWVSPDAGLYPSLSGAEHVQLYAALRGAKLSDDAARALLSRVGLDARRYDLVRTYSSGMRQRLRFACAIVHSPLVLLLDEPFATLDGDGVEMVQRLVQDHRKRGVTVVAGNDARELELADDILSLGLRS